MNELEEAREEIVRTDREMAVLFEQRMKACGKIGRYKAKYGLPVRDPEREEIVIRRGTEMIADPTITPLYHRFQREVIGLSCELQSRLAEGSSVIRVQTERAEYPVYLGRGALDQIGNILDPARETIVVTDSGVPEKYVKKVTDHCRMHRVYVLQAGESSKSVDSWLRLLREMADMKLGRDGCVIAVGGGVPGDLAGFGAACWMRGIDFYNIPTTVLSQVDSSIGGKTAVDLLNIKNVVGAFWTPKAVIVDPDTLDTLPPRQLSAGLAETVKMAATSDAALFRLIAETDDLRAVLPELIRRSLLIKKQVVEEDPRELGLRRVLNFGHTLGHAIEAAEEGKLLHGECVALGMLPMCAPVAREQIREVLKKLGLPVSWNGDRAAVMEYLRMDKKRNRNMIRTVIVDKIGTYRFEDAAPEEILARMEDCL